MPDTKSSIWWGKHKGWPNKPSPTTENHQVLGETFVISPEKSKGEEDRDEGGGGHGGQLLVQDHPNGGGEDGECGAGVGNLLQ